MIEKTTEVWDRAGQLTPLVGVQTSAAHSLARFKQTDEYREMVQDALQRAKLDAITAPSPMEARRARLRILELELEINSAEPASPYSGLIALPCGA